MIEMFQDYPISFLKTNSTNTLATKTITNPIIAAVIVFPAFSILSASPAAVIYVYPAMMRNITATKAANPVAQFIISASLLFANVSTS